MLGLGAVSGVLGVAFAIGQHDLKRLLAYHSIENIGIIVMGLGLALIGRSLGRADWIILGLSGALLHVWNHALFKALLFLSAGSVIHATHTREIDHLGGLAKTMPWTALCFLVGAVAICGLPPLNGFVSEFLIYLGLFGTLADKDGPSFVGRCLRRAGAGPDRRIGRGVLREGLRRRLSWARPGREHARHAHESPPSMLGPMGVLVACCFLIGLAPLLIAPILGAGGLGLGAERDGRRPAPWHAGPAGLDHGHGPAVDRRPCCSVACCCGCGCTPASWTRVRPGAAATSRQRPRMQYTSSSFAQMLVGLFAWALRPRTHSPAVVPLFPQQTDFHSDVPDTVLDEAVLPTFRFGAWLFSWFRVFQQGSIQTYLLYIFLALIALLLWR